MSLTAWARANTLTQSHTHSNVKYRVEPLYQSQHRWVPIHQLCSLVTMGTTDPYLRRGLESNGSYFHTSTTVLPQNVRGNAEREGRKRWTSQMSGEGERESIKGYLQNLQPRPYFPMFLCQSDEWKQPFLKLVQYSRRVQPLNKLQCNRMGQVSYVNVCPLKALFFAIDRFRLL